MSSFAVHDPLLELINEISKLETGENLQTGGSITGNLVLEAPAKVVQSAAPTNADDLVNKAYVDNILTGQAPGPASTLKGTNSLGNLDNLAIGTGLNLSTGSGGVLSVDSAQLAKAGNSQYGVVQFDASGDLVETSSNSGIALIKQPASSADLQSVVGFDTQGKFVSGLPNLGVVKSSSLLPDGNTFTYGKILLRVGGNAPELKSLYLTVSSGTCHVSGSAQPYWLQGTPPTEVVTGRYVYRYVSAAGTYVNVSTRVANEPSESTYVLAGFDTSLAGTDSSQAGYGFIEIYNLHIAIIDGGAVDSEEICRITVVHVDNSTSNITVEKIG